MSIVTQEHIQQFERDGYFILESVISGAVLEALRTECMHYIALVDREMEAKGIKMDEINHYKKRYFISNRSEDSAILTDFLLGDLMVDIVQATLGKNVYLFNEQYVV